MMKIESLACLAAAWSLALGAMPLAQAADIKMPPSSLAGAFDVFAEGLRKTEALAAPADKVVGLKLGLEGPLTLAGRAEMRQPSDPNAAHGGALAWSVGASRNDSETAIDFRVESEGSLDPVAQSYTQNFRGAMTWTIHQERALTTKLRVASDVAIALDSGQATPGIGPEWIATSQLSEAGAPVRSDVSARLNYRVAPTAAPDFSARLEWRLTPRAR
jgi:hypothetical protein